MVLYAGRLAVEKNLSLLIDTLRTFQPQARRPTALIVAGSGPLAPHLEGQLADGRAGAACLWGQVADRGALAALYASADAFLHPNPREPFGIAPLEAMASGLPVVAPRAGGILTYADDGNAWLADPEPGAMADALGAALTPGLVRERRVARARLRAEALDWTAVCRGIFRLYDAIHRDRLDFSARVGLSRVSLALCRRYREFTQNPAGLCDDRPRSSRGRFKGRNMFNHRLEHQGRTRGFLIESRAAGGWDVLEEQDRRVVREVHYDDWHRVERQLTVFAMRVEILKNEGWVSIGSGAASTTTAAPQVRRAGGAF